MLFEMSYNYVGDLAETVALLWPQPDEAVPEEPAPSLSEVVAGLSETGKARLPAMLAGWLDRLDENGRWALLKLITGLPARRRLGAPRQGRAGRARPARAG